MAVKKPARVQFVYEVTGEFDRMTFVEAEPYNAFRRRVHPIRKTEGAGDTSMQLVLQ